MSQSSSMEQVRCSNLFTCACATYSLVLHLPVPWCVDTYRHTCEFICMCCHHHAQMVPCESNHMAPWLETVIFIVYPMDVWIEFQRASKSLSNKTELKSSPFIPYEVVSWWRNTPLWALQPQNVAICLFIASVCIPGWIILWQFIQDGHNESFYYNGARSIFVHTNLWNRPEDLQQMRTECLSARWRVN